MTRRVRVTIGQVTVDTAGVVDRAALAVSIERELARRLAAPGAVDALATRNVASVDGGPRHAGVDGRAVAGGIATALGVKAR